MKFYLHDEGSDDDSLGVVEEHGVNTMTPHVGTRDKALDECSHSIAGVNEKLSCTPSKKYDNDSIAEIVDELGSDDLIDLNNDARDDGEITPIASNRTLGRETEGCENKDAPSEKSMSNAEANQNIPPQQKEKMATLPQHLQSLLINFSRAHAHRRRSI
jgi:hypothetical protein